jgi:hypothetical protein
MTIMATHFALVLGAWRLRIRIDIDEPRSTAAVSNARIHRYVRSRRAVGEFRR